MRFALRFATDGRRGWNALITRLSGIMKDYTMELVRENRRYPRSMAGKQRPKRTVNRVFSRDEIRLFSWALDRYYVNSDNRTFLL